MVVIQARENSRLNLPEEVNNPVVRERLLRCVSGTRHPIFRPDRRGLRVGSVVGMIQVGRISVEILPKATAGTAISELDSCFLVNLLVHAGVLPKAYTRTATTSSTGSPLESVYRLFAQSTLRKLEDGLPRRYHRKTESLEVLKGKPLLRHLASTYPGSPPSILVEYAPLQPDNPLSQLIKATVTTCIYACKSPLTRRMLRQCLRYLTDVKPRILSEQLANSVQLNQFERNWDEQLHFARALSQSVLPSPVSSGPNSSFSIIFTLQHLFETILRNCLREALSDTKTTVALKPWNAHLLRSIHSGKLALYLRPDYAFSEGRSATRLLIGDAKWKVLKTSGKAFGLNPGDAYQLVTYMSKSGSDRGALFYPRQDWMTVDQTATVWRHSYEVLTPDPKRLTLIGVDLRSLVNPSRKVRTSALSSLREAVEDAVT